MPLSPALLNDVQRTAGNGAASRLALQRAPAQSAPPAKAPPKTQQVGSSAAPEGQAGRAQDATDAYAAFDSLYGAYCAKFAFLAMKQQAAIQSLYTEAKKPKKPGIFEELLVTLALAGLGAVGSALASNLERAAEKAMTTRFMADPNLHTGVLRENIQHGRDNLRIVAKAGGDGLKVGINQFVGPRIRELLQKGKSSVDAFYEGQVSSVIDVGDKAAEESTKMGSAIWQLRHIHPELPMIIAQALLDSATATFAAAEEMQKRSTLEQWLAYEAQATQGPNSKAGAADGTDLSNEHWESRTKGVLRVLSHVAGRGTAWRVEPDRGSIAGVTENMLKTLTGPIARLNIPKIYIVSSWELFDGRGVVSDGLGSRSRKQTFHVAVNEKGVLFQTDRYPWQEKALAAVGGVDALLSQLGALELAKLPGVEADQG